MKFVVVCTENVKTIIHKENKIYSCTHPFMCGVLLLIYCRNVLK